MTCRQGVQCDVGLDLSLLWQSSWVQLCINQSCGLIISIGSAMSVISPRIITTNVMTNLTTNDPLEVFNHWVSLKWSQSFLQRTIKRVQLSLHNPFEQAWQEREYSRLQHSSGSPSTAISLPLLSDINSLSLLVKTVTVYDGWQRWGSRARLEPRRYRRGVS